MNIHQALTETLQRIELTLKLHLQTYLSNANSVWALQNDRILNFPARIVANELPNFRLGQPSGKPQVFFRITSSSNPQLDLVGHEDINAILTTSVILTGSGRTASDLNHRAQIYSGCVADTLITHARKSCADTSYGLFNISYESASAPSTSLFEDNFFVRVDQTFNLNIRYLRNSSTTFIPVMPLVDSHLPLNASPNITLVSTLDPEETAPVAPYSALQSLVDGHSWLVPAGWDVKVVNGSNVVSYTAGQTVNFVPTNIYTIIATTEAGIMPTYSFEIGAA